MFRPLWILASLFALAQLAFGQSSNPAVEQSRLYPKTVPSTTTGVNANGLALPQSTETTSEDESFGAQQILKTQEKVPEVTLAGDASYFYTSNVALTRHDTIADSFFVGGVSGSWTPRINNELLAQIGGRVSIFRYADTSDLDFESLGAGVGAIWAPPWSWGITFTGRYDFIELLDRHSDEILQDHEFSFVARKIVPLGRSHALDFALIGAAGISDPFVEQRDQIGGAIAYHLRLTRDFDADLSYRHSWYFYNSGGRTDLNQVFALGLHYHLNRWATIDGFLSYATNYSNRSAFEYDVFNGGGGVSLTWSF